MFKLIVSKDILESDCDIQNVCNQLVHIGFKTLIDNEDVIKPALWYHRDTGFLEKITTKEQFKFAQENEEYQLLFLN